jgi:hypothetical protein
MRLDDARLCLDCEEIHQEQECPGCGSEAFAFLTRWIQSTRPARPTRPSSTPKAPDAARGSGPSREYLDTWRQIVDGTPDDTGRGKKIVTRGLLGLAAMGLAGWAWAKTGDSKDRES